MGSNDFFNYNIRKSSKIYVVKPQDNKYVPNTFEYIKWLDYKSELNSKRDNLYLSLLKKVASGEATLEDRKNAHQFMLKRNIVNVIKKKLGKEELKEIEKILDFVLGNYLIEDIEAYLEIKKDDYMNLSMLETYLYNSLGRYHLNYKKLESQKHSDNLIEQMIKQSINGKVPTYTRCLKK